MFLSALVECLSFSTVNIPGRSHRLSSEGSKESLGYTFMCENSSVVCAITT